MTRRTVSVLVVAAALCAAAPPGAGAHKADPDFDSILGAVTPQVEGLKVQVLNRGDSLELINSTGEDVAIAGYDDEPYIRMNADGIVEVNHNSPAYWTNQDPEGKTPVPPGASASAPPKWVVADRNGRFAWHDHRVHWMGGGRPPQVDDPDARTKVYDWKVPVDVDGRTVTISGTLWWVGKEGGGLSPLTIGGLVALVVLSAVGGIAVRRRRDARMTGGASTKEAW